MKISPDHDSDIILWLQNSLTRVFPRSEPGGGDLDLLTPRNSKIAFQVAYRSKSTRAINLECAVSGADDLAPQVRLVGMVPMRHFTRNTEKAELDGIDHLPGLVPDPLMPTNRALVGPNESGSFWVTLNIPADAKPGKRSCTVRMTLLGNEPISADLPADIEISEVGLQPRRDFPVIHWWRGEATWDIYKTEMFDERWWALTKAQMENMLAHGSDVVYVPVFFDRRETFKRPCQLLEVAEPTPGNYQFGWSQVKRFTDMCKEIGFTLFEWSHLWIYWGVENAVRVYTKQVDGSYVMLWPPETGATSETYVNFLRQFLPEFHQFLIAEDLLDRSFFHLSDEPGSGEHVENYRRARQVLRALAPWMKVMDALSDIEYGKEGLTDIPIPVVSSAQAYIDAAIPHWVYYCCQPQGPWLNRFLDTPLTKVRMSGWLFYRLGALGFLHWGYNYWHKIEQEIPLDPFTDASAASWPGIPYGDPFMIYPGDDGPVDSIRWEVFAESLQDYALLQTAGIAPGDALLAEIKSYADFPKNAEWVEQARERILRRKQPPLPAEAQARH